MKARAGLNKQLTDAVVREVKKEYERTQGEFAKEIAVQTTANLLFALELEYGFKAKRMLRLVDTVTANTQLSNNGVFGKRFSSTDVVMHLKEMGVDLDRLLQVEVVEDEEKQE